MQPPEPADETPRQARASEAQLTADQRKELQVALQWAGFYTSAIDGAFGRGTRRSMSAWQEANGYEVTGVLTTLQRAALIDQYNAVLEGMDLQLVRDGGAGIEIELPLGAVAFSRHEYPFSHYDSASDIGAQVLLISQEGDQDTLYGLYDIMQTLEIVPLDGPRSRNKGGFTLTGANDRIISHTEATLRGGTIKGFTLIWPAGDEERRSRILAAMQNSFTPVEGVLDPTAGANAEQNVDLVAGLTIRKPKISRSGFYVDQAGAVITTTEVVEGCSRITLEDEYQAEIATRDDIAGIALLRPAEALAPLAVATYPQFAPRLKSEVAVAGYSYQGVLGAPTLTFGTLDDLRGLQGEANLRRLALNTLPGDAGGPVFDTGGAVLGMLLPGASGNRKLPEGVSFAVDADTIRSLLENAGMAGAEATAAGQMAPEDLTDLAQGMTVLVSCWD